MSLNLWSKKKNKKVTVENKLVYTNLTPFIQLSEPQALEIQYNVDKPYNVTHSESDKENNNETLLDQPQVWYLLLCR